MSFYAHFHLDHIEIPHTMVTGFGDSVSGLASASHLVPLSPFPLPGGGNAGGCPESRTFDFWLPLFCTGTLRIQLSCLLLLSICILFDRSLLSIKMFLTELE